MNEKLKKLISENTKVENFNLDSDFDDLGMDSLDKITFVIYLEEEFKIEIADETFSEWKTIGDVQEYLEKEKII